MNSNLKKAKIPRKYVDNKKCLNITKEALSCLDKLDGSCKKIITNVGICSNNFIKNNKQNKNKKGEMVTISYAV